MSLAENGGRKGDLSRFVEEAVLETVASLDGAPLKAVKR